MSSQQNTDILKDQLENLNSHLIMIKSLKDSEAEVEYCNLLEKAKFILGDLSPYMAKFYYEYGNFLLNKVQNSMDLFNENAVPGAQDDDAIAEYASAYEDQSQIQQNGGNSQKVEKQEEKQQKIESKTEKGQQKEQKIVYLDDNIQITENRNDKIVQKQEQAEVHKIENEEDSTDLEIAYENLQVALLIFQNQRNKLENGEDSVLQKDEIFKYILALHSRIGELYMFDERFDDSIAEYNALIKMTRGADAPELRRRASEAHYNIGNCYLHMNKENCQMLAIEEYIAAQEELLKFIEETQHYDISKIQIPTLKKFKVDRFGYLYKPFDSEVVRDLKDVMSLLLDKIEDTALQIQTRPSYEKEKARMNEMKENSGFKEVSKDVKVTNLGKFGNRKRSEPPSVLEEARNQVEKQRASAIPETIVNASQSKQLQNESKEQPCKEPKEQPLKPSDI